MISTEKVQIVQGSQNIVSYPDVLIIKVKQKEKKYSTYYQNNKRNKTVEMEEGKTMCKQNKKPKEQ